VATPADASASDAARARDEIEEQARIVYAAALLWVATHGEDEEPDEGTPLAKASTTLALMLLRAVLRQSASPVPLPTGEARGRWIEDHTRAIARRAVADSREHYSTVHKRMHRDDPTLSDRAIRTVFRAEGPWSEAAARTAATRLAAETPLSMREAIEAETGEPHSVMWISRGDPKVRKLHRRLHGKVRPAGDPFYTWPDGKSLNYPGDVSAPIEAWINCRCALLLVPTSDAGLAEAVFEVPDADFDVPLAAAGVGSERVRAERELRSELARRYL
jgi:hypothetical protein